jgi:hypothetical protein
VDSVTLKSQREAIKGRTQSKVEHFKEVSGNEASMAMPESTLSSSVLTFKLQALYLAGPLASDCM